jgi:hypothetical protein
MVDTLSRKSRLRLAQRRALTVLSTAQCFREDGQQAVVSTGIERAEWPCARSVGSFTPRLGMSVIHARGATIDSRLSGRT